MKTLTCPRGSARRFEFAGGCQKLKTSDIQPQPPTPALVILFLTIYLLKPLSASADFADSFIISLDFWETPMDSGIHCSFASGYSSYFSPSRKKVGLNGTVVRPLAALVVTFPRGKPDESELASVADYLFLSVASSLKLKNDSPNYVSLRYLIFQVSSIIIKPKEDRPKFGANFSSHSLGHPALPDSDCVAVNINHHGNASGVVVPFVLIHPSVRADVQTAIGKVMKDGSNLSIIYDPRTECSSVVWRDADGNFSNGTRCHNCPYSSAVSVVKNVVKMVDACVIGHYLVLISESSYGTQLQLEKATDYWLKWRPIVMGGVVVLVTIIVAWVNYRSEVSSPERERGGEEGNHSAKLTEEFEKLSGTKKFSYEELMIATDSFAHDRILGEGGFGTVYKGYMGGARTVVAVKKIKSGSRQGVKEYISEVKSLSQLRHRNLVQLIGYCHKASEFVLVYEFMTGGSLEDHLFKGRPLLTWERRYNIAIGLASAVHYLHKQYNQCVIHRDIKASNTMLDERFEAKLGDFGLARLVDHAEEPKATEVAGTLGYVAPEYHRTGEASKESDVYSFGIVLLEIVCGRRVIEDQGHIVEWVRQQHGRGKLPVDSKLCRDFDKKQAKALMIAGLWCAHPDVSCRPSIEAAMAVLNLKADLSNLPSDIRQSRWKVWSRGYQFWANASL